MSPYDTGVRRCQPRQRPRQRGRPAFPIGAFLAYVPGTCHPGFIDDDRARPLEPSTVPAARRVQPRGALRARQSPETLKPFPASFPGDSKLSSPFPLTPNALQECAPFVGDLSVSELSPRPCIRHPPKISYGLRLDVDVICAFMTVLAKLPPAQHSTRTARTFSSSFSSRPSTVVSAGALSCGVLHFTVSVRHRYGTAWEQ